MTKHKPSKQECFNDAIALHWPMLGEVSKAAERFLKTAGYKVAKRGTFHVPKAGKIVPVNWDVR